jgi:adenine-specific DNA methylase
VSDLLKAGMDTEIHKMLQNRTKISLDFSVITLTDKRDDAIVTIDSRDFTVSELKRLLQEK